jgi:hypothetical protein
VSVFDRFLNGEWNWTVDFPIVDPDNPANWTGIGKTIAGSLFAGIAAGVIGVFDAIFQAGEQFVGGFQSFVAGETVTKILPNYRFAGPVEVTETPGIVGALFDPLIGAVGNAWAVNLDQFGAFALPAALVIVLAALYLLSRGAQTAAGIWRGS